MVSKPCWRKQGRFILEKISGFQNAQHILNKNKVALQKLDFYRVCNPKTKTLEDTDFTPKQREAYLDDKYGKSKGNGIGNGNNGNGVINGTIRLFGYASVTRYILRRPGLRR